MSRQFIPKPSQQVQVFHGPEALRQAGDAWQALEESGACPTPFQAWRWVSAWQKNFSHGEPVLLLARDDDGMPLALLPLQLERHMGFARLTWLSVPGLQYGGLLLHPCAQTGREEIFLALWEELLRQRADYIDLPLLPANDAFAAFLARHCHAGADNASFRIDFSGHEDWRAYELSLKSSARRARKKRLNKLKRAGELTFTVHAPGPDMAPVLARALEWKRGWLKAQGLEGALPFTDAFARLLDDLFARRGEKSASTRWLVAVLALDGEPIAVDAGKVCGDAFYSWFSAYDADHAEHSPGKIALWLMMQWCMEQGLKAYDMLANPTSYKEEWANQRVELAHFLKPLSVAGRAWVLWATHGAPLAREMYHSLPPGMKAAVRRPLMYLRNAGK